MKELFWTKIRILFFQLVLVGLLLPLMGIGFVFGQTYKMYYKNVSTDNPHFFSVKDMAYNSLNNSLMVGGEFRSSNSATTSHGYIFETNMAGLEVGNYSMLAPVASTDDAFRMGGIAIDPLGRTYVAGSFAPDLNNPSSTTEKTLTGLDFDGKLRWSKMEGSRHFADIVYDKDDNSIVAFGSPDGAWNFSEPLAIMKMTTDGTIKTYYSIYDPDYNQPVKIIDLPNNNGYLALAIYDSAGLKAPYILRFDQSLKRVWSYVYSNFLYEYEVTDIAYHPNGWIGVAGTSYDPISDEKKAFLMSLDDQGRVKFSYQLKVSSQGDTEGFGLSYVKHDTDPTYDGFMLGGAFEPSFGTASRHSLMLHCNLDGKIIWAKDYSNFSLADFVEDEAAKRLMFLEGTNTFVAAGEYKATIGSQLYHKQIWIAKANIEDGDLRDGGSCSTPVSLDIVSDTLGIYRAGTDTTLNPVFFGYNYPISSLNFSRINCSYSTDGRGQQTTTSNEALEQPLVPLADKIEVYDLTGRMLLKTDGRDPNWKEGLSSGVYLLRKWKGKQMLSSEKVVLP